MALQGRVCIVTGASRGIGKGIAVQLGEAGATVYITGRTAQPTDTSYGSLEATADEITKKGGKGIAVYCDHKNQDDVTNLFNRVKTDQHGRLDLLVNNAYSAVNSIMKATGKKFYEIRPQMWDDVNEVGLRNHYYCTWHAAQMMVPRKQGLIVMISSPGGLQYLFNTAYGIGKEALDRMAADCAVELKKTNVACVSLWPGAVRTEMISDMLQSPNLHGKTRDMFEKGETPEYVGKAVAALLNDPNLMKKTGRTLLTADLGQEYGFKDIDGTSHISMRSVASISEMMGYKKLQWMFPHWLKLPGWVLRAFTSRL